MFTEPNLQGGILNTLFALIFAIVVVAVIWSLSFYFSESGNDHGKAEGKAMILQWTTYLLLLMCLYGLVEWIRGAVGF